MSTIQVRVDDDLKLQASSIYERLGLDLSSAIRMFLRRSVSANGIPFTMILDDQSYDAKKALQAMRNMNESAKLYGISEMSLDEINEEIANYRMERRDIK
ncbi:MAG: type II toxin-antitoxin system RelB/DinJ family antitoxin [Flexilinea sp.]|nr:type II toxin-antitoxin system RelB/DinJ family antitoxin [Flexilinea sp.]